MFNGCIYFQISLYNSTFICLTTKLFRLVHGLAVELLKFIHLYSLLFIFAYCYNCMLISCHYNIFSSLFMLVGLLDFNQKFLNCKDDLELII